MSFSLNEAEATAKKAARGAGYPWGLAEEAGKAVRWLFAQGLDGAAALAPLLGMGFAADPAAHRPQHLQGPWQAAGPLCPLATGAALSDSAARLRQAPLQIGPVAQPALLLPFAALAARQLGLCITLEGNGLLAVTDGTGLRIEGRLPDAPATLALRIEGSLPPSARRCSRAAPDPAAWDTLNRFAHKTYAPATELSRRLGAGSGPADSD